MGFSCIGDAGGKDQWTKVEGKNEANYQLKTASLSRFPRYPSSSSSSTYFPFIHPQFLGFLLYPTSSLQLQPFLSLSFLDSRSVCSFQFSILLTHLHFTQFCNHRFQNKRGEKSLLAILFFFSFFALLSFWFIFASYS